MWAACPKHSSSNFWNRLRELFKDEVRELGVASVCRMTWSIAILSQARVWACASWVRSSQEFADLLRQADAIFIDELRAAGWYEKTSQAFAVFLPVKSVGVMGDGRTYEYVVALRAVETSGLHDRRWAELPHELLGRVSTASSTRCAASIAWCTTSRASRRRRSSGNDSASFGVYRDLSKIDAKCLSRIENVCRDLSTSIGGMPSSLTVNLTVKNGDMHQPIFYRQTEVDFDGKK
jgi:hypothetical protein